MDKVRESLSSVEANAESIKGTLERMQNDRGVQGVINTHVHGMGSMWHGLAIGAALSAAIFGAMWIGFAVQRVQASVDAERHSREQMDNWTAQEVTAIRSYITNGRLKPMESRPITEEKK